MMFFAHVAVGLAAKPLAPKASLGSLLLAATAIDTLSFAFASTGIEKVDAGGLNSSIAWSHGLFMAAVWSIAGLAVALMFSRDRRTAAVIGLVVFSHWVLDFISHPMGLGHKLPPDLPRLFAGSPQVGLGLYNSSLVVALVIELTLLAGGAAFYLLNTGAKDRAGKWAVWLLLLFTVALAPLVTQPQLAVPATIAMVLFLPVGIWMDRHRVLATIAEKGSSL